MLLLCVYQRPASLCFMLFQHQEFCGLVMTLVKKQAGAYEAKTLEKISILKLYYLFCDVSGNNTSGISSQVRLPVYCFVELMLYLCTVLAAVLRWY